MKIKIKTKLSQRSNVDRLEKAGECYKSINGKHFYLVRENDVLHVTDGCINTLYDNAITVNKNKFGEKYVKIDRKQFNQILNNIVFELDYIGNDYRSV